MLIPLGILAQSRQAVAASDFVLLETQVLTGSQASVTFSGLASYAATYKHLQIRATANYGTAGSFFDNMRVQVNADTGSNYAFHRLRGTGSSVTSESGTSVTNMILGAYATSSSTAPNVIDILDPFSTAKNTTFRALVGAAESTDRIISLNSGVYLNTAALTQIRLFTSSGEFQIHSRFSLYGIRG